MLKKVLGSKSLMVVRCLLGSSFLLAVQTTSAATLLDYLTDAEGRYTGPTVEEQVAKMDTDNNGFCDVNEIREYLESEHGKGYMQATLDRWQTNSQSKSCGTTNYVDDFTIGAAD